MKSITTASLHVIFVAIALAACSNNDQFRADGTKIGNELLTTQQSSMVVHIGDDTRKAIAEIASVRPSIQVRIGDATSGIGDGSAHFIIVYVANGKDLLAIRMKKADNPGKYHILGFWVPRH